MANTYTQIYIQVIFAVECRQALIRPENKEELHWVKGRFSWQSGFGGFSYSRSGLDAVIRYIQNQDQHHARRSFKDEYMRLLQKFDVAFDERYLFDFADKEPRRGVDS